uniref:BED-type domain-containing protein n=1 Tax=Romanomermis culicivorax TaxID=13658 RepID=A0A915IFB5_ROMCU
MMISMKKKVPYTVDGRSFNAHLRLLESKNLCSRTFDISSTSFHLGDKIELGEENQTLNDSIYSKYQYDSRLSSKFELSIGPGRLLDRISSVYCFHFLYHHASTTYHIVPLIINVDWHRRHNRCSSMSSTTDFTFVSLSAPPRIPPSFVVAFLLLIVGISCFIFGWSDNGLLLPDFTSFSTDEDDNRLCNLTNIAFIKKWIEMETMFFKNYGFKFFFISRVWDNFTVSPDDEENAKCTECEIQLRRKGRGIGYQRKHLEKKHPAVYKQFAAKEREDNENKTFDLWQLVKNTTSNYH